jgi:hypothetical protein
MLEASLWLVLLLLRHTPEWTHQKRANNRTNTLSDRGPVWCTHNLRPPPSWRSTYCVLAIRDTGGRRRRMSLVVFPDAGAAVPAPRGVPGTVGGPMVIDMSVPLGTCSGQRASAGKERRSIHASTSNSTCGGPNQCRPNPAGTSSPQETPPPTPSEIAPLSPGPLPQEWVGPGVSGAGRAAVVRLEGQRAHSPPQRCHHRPHCWPGPGAAVDHHHRAAPAACPWRPLGCAVGSAARGTRSR